MPDPKPSAEFTAQQVIDWALDGPKRAQAEIDAWKQADYGRTRTMIVSTILISLAALTAARLFLAIW